MPESHEDRSAAAGDDPAVEIVDAEVVDAEIVEDDDLGTPGGGPAATPRTPGGEAGDMPVDSDPSRSPDGGPSLTPPTSGEGPGAPDQAAAVDSDLDQLLSDTQRQRDEYLELAQRTRADFDNYRKRMTAEVKASGTRAKADFAGSLISVLDNLEHALVAAGIEPAAALEGKVSADGQLQQGVALTYRELASVLARAGVEPYDPAGEAFDPTWHEALQTRPVDGTPAGAVVEVLQKGYRLDGQVIRAARVVVSE